MGEPMAALVDLFKMLTLKEEVGISRAKLPTG